MPSPLPMLLLSGFMGTGKTTLGRALAEREGVPFFDLDDLVTTAAGRPISAIFTDSGEAAFRALETAALLRVLDENSGAPCIVALGGGSLLDPANRRAALARARVVTLTARPSTIAERTHGSPRPLLDSTTDRPARIRELLAARTSAYAESHAHIATDDRSPESLLDAVHRAWSDPTLVVPLGAVTYPVRLTSTLESSLADTLTALHPSSVFIVTDDVVNHIWGASFSSALADRGVTPAATVVLPSGEPNKRLAAVESCLSTMIQAGADRSSVVIAHGGGVVSDIAGFAASTLLRGVRWLVVPTTLLAMVDASIGGKTGVDLGPAKNAVGAFHQPRAVLIDPSRSSTEEPRGFRSGLAEVVKSACIGDPALFDRIESAVDAVVSRDTDVVRDLVVRSAAVKVAVVSADERETGVRALLNFGHTLGHALEAQGGFERLTHGEAVSLGMVAMLRVGEVLGVTPPAVTARVTDLLRALGLPVELHQQPVAASLQLLSLDKKRTADSLRIVLLRSIGDAVLHTLRIPDLASLLTQVAERH